MNHPVTIFCIGKYAKLAEYFKDITILDLTKLNNQEIISSFPYELNLLIKVFLKESSIEKILRCISTPNIVFNYNNDSDDNDDDNYFTEIYQPYEVISKIEGANIINLSNKIVTSSSSSTEKLNVKNIYNVFGKLEDKTITFLDLSWNGLYDNDLNYIVNAIKEFDVKIEGISLSCNNISGYNKNTREKTYENLYYLLENCEYVDLSMNSFVTVDHKDFFKLLEKDNPSFLLSLIWIPEMWLERKEWQGMVCKELHYEIRDIHRTYYRWLKTLPMDMQIL